VNFYGRLRYHDLTLSAATSARGKDIPTASFRPPSSTTATRGLRDYRAYLDLKYQRRLSETVELSARAFYDRYTFYGDYPYDYANPGDPPDRVVFRDEALGEWIGTELQATTQLFGRDNRRHRLRVPRKPARAAAQL